MHFTTLISSLLTLTTLVTANSSPYGPHRVHCSRHVGTTVYKTKLAYSVSEIETIIGVFQKGEWQGIPIASTSGAPNAKGGKRNLSYAGLILGEELTFSHISKIFFEQKWRSYNGPFDLGVLQLESYYERLTVSPTCGDGKKASKVVWRVDFCADNVTLAADTFNAVHKGGFATVVKDLGGREFTKCEDCYY